ncbi:MAG: hypothetical protein A3J62_00145 [Candidatus Buchananbacteria bacterium RIFCSPHIGHO2_02_FULL_38_8]|uniref:Uncharacterized protein n=1 Tax=Candidatus Buchananbacteria bacterium RIFCSPHIGHO2_02_FULL_38_8 TaxID=1797538 RepID=A0A1G1Y7N8_9BACT|nr:MAG: hypothetical protein A3J62_00145 [Candidatus Buchananbacteria bacterium RIFCSPHIGHO2_02_FULL_38_8]
MDNEVNDATQPSTDQKITAAVICHYCRTLLNISDGASVGFIPILVLTADSESHIPRYRPAMIFGSPMQCPACQRKFVLINLPGQKEPLVAKLPGF